MESLDNLKLMAQGGQAKIYHYGDDKVLRVLRNPNDAALLQNEIDIMKALKDWLDVPEVFDSMTIDGRPAVVVEKIIGLSMLDYIKKHPLKLAEQAALLAKLHTELPEDIDICGLRLAKERARYLIDLTKLEPGIKEFVFSILSELPEGTALCHGDFHPGNILKSGDKNFLIDWLGAYKGVLLSDVAHTYLLLKNVPKFPGISTIQHRIMTVSGSILAGKYLKAFYKLRPFDWAEFSKWLLIKAAERVCYGMDAEKPKLNQFIQTCRKNESRPENWFNGL